MTRNLKNALGAIAIALTLGVTYVMNFGLYPRYFDIAWNEEVQLHDGRVILVHVTRTFERRGMRLDRWDGIHRDTEISFDAGGTIGRFTKKFERYDTAFLHNKDGNWYFALGVTTGTPPVELVTREKSVLVLKRDGTQFAIRRDELPSEFRTFNIMPLTPSSVGVAQFDGKKLTISEKRAHWQANLRAAGDGPDMQIPTFRQTTQGETK